MTKVLNGAKIRKTNGVITTPVHDQKIILVEHDAPFQEGGSRLHISTDGGQSYKKVNLPFICRISTIHFSTVNDDRILMKSKEEQLYVSKDFGMTWSFVNTNVLSAQWDGLDGDMFYYTLDPTGTYSYFQTKNEMSNDMYRVRLNGESKLIARDAHSFLVNKHFLLLSAQFCGKNGSRVLYVSKNQGHAWNAAQLPMIGDDQFYSFLDLSEDMVFLHVDKPGDTGHGDLYTSDERGIVYSKSLEKHLYPNGDTESINDFFKVNSMYGSYITSQLANDSSVHTVVTHDKGSTWNKIDAPKLAVCSALEKECKLHIHNYFSQSKNVLLPQYPISSNNTVGLIMAHGNIGDGLSVEAPSVYISRDGGYEWTQPPQLKGPHYYGIADGGSVLYAVKYEPTKVVNSLWYSLDEGQCWHEHIFTEGNSTGIIVTGLLAEPRYKAGDLTIWGYDPYGPNKPWTVFFINFKTLMTRQCGDGDYEKWTGHNFKCVLGSEMSFMRRKMDTFCLNGEQLDATPFHKPCTCAKQDFMCDFGFERDEKTGECLEYVKEGKGMDICIDHEEFLVSQKTRKIPGDKCEGGLHVDPPKLVKKSCVDFNFTQDPDKFPTCASRIFPADDGSSRATPSGSGASSGGGSGSHTGVIVFLVLLVIVLAIAVAVVVYYKRETLLRVRYRNLNDVEGLLGEEFNDDDDDGLVTTNNQQLNSNKHNTTSQSASLVAAGSNGDGVYTTVLQSPGNLPNSSQQGGGLLPYHDDSDDDLLMT